MAETSMHNFLETDIEQMSQLPALVEAQLDYHQQAVQILDELAKKLKRRMQEASLDSSGSISPSLGSPLTSESLSSPTGLPQHHSPQDRSFVFPIFRQAHLDS